VAVIAFVPVLLAHGLRLAAGVAEELHMQQVTTRYQAAQHIRAAACERAAYCASSLLSFVFFMQQLTVVGIEMAVATDRQQSTSLHTAQQQQ